MKRHLTALMALFVAALALGACATETRVTHQQESILLEERIQDASVTSASGMFDSLLFRYQNLQEELTEMKLAYAEMIPASRVRVTIPLENLMTLPEGGMYGASEGRARVEAERSGNNVILTGISDSVARMCSFYERSAFRLQETNDSLQAKVAELNSTIAQMDSERRLKEKESIRIEEKTNRPRDWPKVLAAGTLLGIGIDNGARFLIRRTGIVGIVKGVFKRA